MLDYTMAGVLDVLGQCNSIKIRNKWVYRFLPISLFLIYIYIGVILSFLKIQAVGLRLHPSLFDPRKETPRT